jgi:predicted lipoprotein
MKINENDRMILKSIQTAYLAYHNQLDNLEKMTNEIDEKRKEISRKLNMLRLNEKGVINKIEQDNGVKLTTESLMEILKNEN